MAKVWICALVTSDALCKPIKLSACLWIIPGMSYFMKSTKRKPEHLYPKIYCVSSGCDFTQSNKLSRLPEISWKIKLVGPWMLPSIFSFSIELMSLNLRFVSLFFAVVESFDANTISHILGSSNTCMWKLNLTARKPCPLTWCFSVVDKRVSFLCGPKPLQWLKIL